ncbi:flagellar protein FlaG [Bacillus spongiae]|uniref:Flagellar protein FlaG n=1 Tax=Bacillus spongiae TaxID=2683610 RepID=A0ABU8HE82_9BACI
MVNKVDLNTVPALKQDSMEASLSNRPIELSSTLLKIEQDAVQQEIPPKEQVEKVIHSVNEFLKASPTSLKFEFHEKLQEYFVSVIDNETKEVVREIPPKKLLDMYAAMTEFVGILVDKKI